MNRHHRRRQAKLDRDKPNLRLVRSMSIEDGVKALFSCHCPALITTGAGLVTIEHAHTHGCSALYRMMRDQEA